MVAVLLHLDRVAYPVVAAAVSETHHYALPVALVACIFLEVDVVYNLPVVAALLDGPVRGDGGEWLAGDVAVEGIRALPRRLRRAVVRKLVDVAVVCVDAVRLVALAVFGGGGHAGARWHVPHWRGCLGGREAIVVGEGVVWYGVVGHGRLRPEQKGRGDEAGDGFHCRLSAVVGRVYVYERTL